MVTVRLDGSAAYLTGTVNGKAITQQSLDQFVKLLVGQGAPDTPALREQVKQEMINREVMVQAAEKAGIAKEADIKTELELARQGILVRALMADYLKKNPVTEQAVQAEYDKLKKEQANVFEYQVRHILVEDEKLANDLQSQLKDKKAKFEDLAKKNSKDPGSAEKGGDLGWIARGSGMVKPPAPDERGIMVTWCTGSCVGRTWKQMAWPASW